MNLTTAVITENPFVISSGLVAYWSFNEQSGSVAHDFTNGKNDVILMGVASSSWKVGAVGAGCNLTGSDGYGYFPVGHTLPLGNTLRTFVAWVYVPSTSISSSNPAIKELLNYGAVANGQRIVWYYNTANGLTGSVAVDIYGASITTNAVSLNYDAWNHLALAIIGTSGNSTFATLYKDGVAQAATLIPQAISINTQAGPSHWIGGDQGTAAAPATIVNGFIIDDFRVYNRVLSASEINTLYNARGT